MIFRNITGDCWICKLYKLPGSFGTLNNSNPIWTSLSKYITRVSLQITWLEAELPSRCEILYSDPTVYVKEIPDFHAVISNLNHSKQMSVFPVWLTQSAHQNSLTPLITWSVQLLHKGNVPQEAAAILPDLLCPLTQRWNTCQRGKAPNHLTWT